MKLPWWAVLLLTGLVGCASATRAVRLDTGLGPATVLTPRTGEARFVELEDEAFERAMARLARDVPASASPRGTALRLLGGFSEVGASSHLGGSVGLVSVEDPRAGRLTTTAPRAGTELTLAYGRWCARKARSGDCLHLLEESDQLGEDGKRTLALSIALDSVWDETNHAFKDMADPMAVRAAIITSMGVYLTLWLLPEPVSKGLAATLTAALIAYLGVNTVWGLIHGWIQLSDAVKVATTFDAVRAAGERYGEVLGANAARAFVMLATAAIGSTAGLAAKLPTLPGAAQAAQVAAAQGGFRLAAVAQVEAVAVSSEGAFTIALAPGAVAMSALGPGEAPGASVNWKGFSKGSLASHYEKHVKSAGEFGGSISQRDYLRLAKEFAAEQGGGFLEKRVGNFVVKFDPKTRRVFIGHLKEREIRTFYQADGRTSDPFSAAIELATEAGQ